jgi:alpha-glucosidase
MSDDSWWRGAVIYQIYPRSFCDSNGDGIGDLPGIISKLDYIADLGVDAIWMSPFYPSPMIDFGYDITAHCEVHPDYGTMEDFERLVEEAHDRGLKVIIDAVLNHTAIDHPWFEESRQDRTNDKADWYQWVDPKPDGSPPNNWISRYADSQWTWCPVREQYYRHQYLKEQPALNLANPDVVKARLGFMRKWLDRGVDGFRFDAVPQYYSDPDLRDNPPGDPKDGSITPVDGYSTFAYQLHEHDCNDERIEDFVRSLVEEVRCAGCTFTYAELDVRYKAYDSLQRYTGKDLLDAAYTPDAMGMSLKPSSIAGIARKVEDKVCMGHHVWALTNHDASRIVSRWAGEDADDASRAQVSKLAAALVPLFGGQVSFLQGEELGLPDAPYRFDEIKDPQGLRFWPKGKGRDPIRHPFPWSTGPGGGFTSSDEPWLPIKTEVTRYAADTQANDAASVRHKWQEMIALRRNHEVLRYGSMHILEADDATGVLGIERRHDGEVCQGWYNTSAEPADFSLPEGEVLASSDEEVGEPYSWVIVRLRG